MVNEQIYQQLAEQIGPENVNKISSLLGIPTNSAIIIFAFLTAIVLIWSLIWKGLALWKSAKKDHKFWFILLLIINTVGIFEIIYIFILSKMNWDFKKKKSGNLKKKLGKKR